MKNSSKIIIQENDKHLGAQIKKVPLPKNCIFDKGRVGCGGTSLAIESDIPYIICVPFVSIIENKLGQYPNERYSGEVYGFYGNNNLKKDLVAYLNRVKVPKIIVTYDSLEKLTKWINPADYCILIDELHLLFTEYSYRNEAAQSVLKNYLKYKEFCFMTATPLEEEFLLDELKHLPVVEAVWPNNSTVTVQSVKCIGKVKDTVIEVINSFKNNEHPENAYFFVNSVSYIADIITACELTDKNTRVIYSKNNKKEVGITRGSTLDNPKKINFITSTAFEGSDIYDENGLTFIISDSSETNTLVDISTKFQQIAGRIRDSKYSDKIYHIFKETRYSSLSYDEFKLFTDKTINDTKQMIKDISGKSYADKISTNALYVRKEGNIFSFDPNMVKIDLYNFKICRNLYSLRVNLKNEYEKYNFMVEEYDHLAESIIISNTTSQSFEEVVKAVENESKDIYRLHTPIKDAAFLKYPFLEEAITKLGFEEIAKCNYIITNVKAKLIKTLDSTEDVKVIMALKNRLSFISGDFIEGKKIKDTFQKIYSDLEISKKAKSTDLLRYYDVKDNKETSKWINGKKVKGYIILRAKTIFNN